MVALFRLFLVVLAASLGAAAQADSWVDPAREVYHSANKQYRLTVDPAPEEEVDAYYEADDEDRKALRPNAIGRLERKLQNDTWETVWDEPLLNEVAPTHALVSDDGRYVITFDNWYSTGHGENVVVIYRADGSLVRSMELTDLVPDYYKGLLDHTVSSVLWKKGEGFTSNSKLLFVDVLLPGEDPYSQTSKSVRFKIQLNDGTVSLPPPAVWQPVLSKARRDALETLNINLRWEKMLRGDLLPPEACNEFAWEQYLHELIGRMAKQGAPEPSVSTNFLFPRGADMHENRFVNFQSWTARLRPNPNLQAVAAPCAPDELLEAAEQMARKSRDRSEKYTNTTLYVSAPEILFEKVAQHLRPTGMTVIWLDPKVPVPQRPDRVPDNLEFIAEIEAYRASLMAEIEAEKAAVQSNPGA